MESGLLKIVRKMRITGPGLTTIAILTAILWACLIAEQWTFARARAEAYRALDDIRALQLRKRILPATAPVRAPRPAGPEIG